MELIYTDSGELQNKLGETVDVEPDYVVPLMKSSDLFNGSSITKLLDARPRA